MAPISRMKHGKAGDSDMIKSCELQANSIHADNFCAIEPCSHLNSIFGTKAKSTVISTYKQAIEVVVLNNNVIYGNSTYCWRTHGGTVSHNQLTGFRSKVLRCFSCESLNFQLLFICLQCPHVGCYKDHALKHFTAQRHSFAIDSLNGLLYCFQCQNYTNHNELNNVRISAVLRQSDPLSANLEIGCIDDQYTKPSYCAALGLKGIVNFGSTCFMSCILQAMLHNPLVQFQFFHNDDHFFKCAYQNHYLSNGDQIDEYSACVTCLIDSTFKEVYTSSNLDDIGITSLLTTAWYKNRQLAGFLEQDAHEFWQFLLNELHNDYERISEKKNTSPIDCGCIMHSIFLGELESFVTCGFCGAITNKIDPLIDLSLEIGDGQGQPNLYDCLDKFTRDELLDVNYKCGSCHHEAEARRTLRIKVAPPVLSIQLKRFKHDFTNDSFSKIEDHVGIPLFLNLTKYTSDYVKGNGENLDECKIYELHAVVNHMGLVNTGHYVTYVKNANGQWLKFDDSLITVTSADELKNLNAYLLFYIARNL